MAGPRRGARTVSRPAPSDAAPRRGRLAFVALAVLAGFGVIAAKLVYLQLLDAPELAARADFILGLYNPKGKKRVEPFELTCEILARHRSPETPVGLVRAAYRAGQAVELITLAELPAATVNMVTIIIVGNSRTGVYNGKMVTSRGYAGKYELGQ